MAMLARFITLWVVVTLVAFGLLLANSSGTETITKPSTPEFSAKLISSPENQPVNNTIELTIKNQPAVSFYNVRMKVNDYDWILLYPNNNTVQPQSNGEYTILSYHSGALGVENQYFLGYTAQNFSVGDQVDFQIKAMAGNIHRVYNPNFTCQLDMYPYVFIGEESDWSSTQTIVFSDCSSSVHASPDSFYDLTFLLVLMAFAVLIFTAILLLYFNQLKRKM